MNIKSRLKRIEQVTHVSGDFCQCSSPWIKIFTNADRPEGYSSNQCFHCWKKINHTGHEIEVLTPKTNYTREEFNEWQDTHVISGKITYEEYLRRKDEH